MALPKQRHTHHRRDRARRQYNVTPKKLQTCSKCQANILGHRICPKCGTYKGRTVIDMAPKLKKEKAAA